MRRHPDGNLQSFLQSGCEGSNIIDVNYGHENTEGALFKVFNALIKCQFDIQGWQDPPGSFLLGLTWPGSSLRVRKEALFRASVQSTSRNGRGGALNIITKYQFNGRDGPL